MAYRGRPENVVRSIAPWPDGWELAVAMYRAELDARHLAFRTIENYMTIIRRLAVRTQKPPAEITRVDLVAMMGRGIAANSAQVEGTAYKVFFRALREMELIESDPALKLPRVKVRRGTPRPMTAEQYAALFKRPGGSQSWASTQAMLILAGFVGMRAHEIAKVRGEMFDLVDNTVTYLTKGNFERVQPLHPVVRALAEQMPRRGWWFPSPKGNGPVLAKTVSTRFGIRIRAAGIDDPRITGHSIRHMFATQMAKDGIDILVIKELMGHELLTSTQIYAQVDQSQKVEALTHLQMPDVPLVQRLARSSGIPSLTDRRAALAAAPSTASTEGSAVTTA